MTATERETTEAANRRTLWREENREAIEAYKRYIETNGIPLAKYSLSMLPVAGGAPK